MSGILGHLLRIGFFLVIGPIMGGLALVIGAAVTGHPQTLGLLILLPFFLAGCYAMGWKAALLAGLIISLIGSQFESRQGIVIASAIVGALVSSIVGPGEIIEGDGAIALSAFLGAAAAAPCAWFLDRINLMRPEKSPSV